MSFKDWFEKQWKKNGGLISETTAAKLLDLSLARIYKLRKEGKIREFIYENDKTTYLAKADVDILAKLYEAKRKIQEQIDNL